MTLSILGLLRWNKNWDVKNSYSYVATATIIQFHFQFPRSPDATFGGLIGWLFNWKCKNLAAELWATWQIISNTFYFWDGDGIDNVTLRFWKFSDFCSRHCRRCGWWYHVPHSSGGWKHVGQQKYLLLEIHMIIIYSILPVVSLKSQTPCWDPPPWLWI